MEYLCNIKYKTFVFKPGSFKNITKVESLLFVVNAVPL